MKNLFIKRTLSPFMSTFEFVNKIGFNFLRNEIVESNVFSLYNGYIYVYFFVCVKESYVNFLNERAKTLKFS